MARKNGTANPAEHAVAHASRLYGSIGVILAVLAWLFFFGRLIVYAAVVNVINYEGAVGTEKRIIEVPRYQEVPGEVARAGEQPPREQRQAV